MMIKFMDFMSNSFTPVVNKITKNPWISSIQDAVMTLLPLILVGSLITIVSLFNNIFPNIPDFSLINSFTFGLQGLLVAFLIPYYVMEKKKHHNKKILAGVTSLAVYLMLLSPVISDDGQITFIFSRFGATGMFLSLVIGLVVAGVMNFFAKKSLFSKDSMIPEFVIVWFDSLIPITLVMVISWIIAVPLNIDFFDVILKIFDPLSSIVQSYPGFVLSLFIPALLYTFGISGWVMMPVIYPVYLAGLAENAERVAQGLEPTNIALQETAYGFINMGGIGATLALSVMMVIFSSSYRLKAIGRATIVPSMFNINEPLMFGGPIVFNPFLMIPMWISSIVIPSIVYFVMKLGLVTIPSKTFLLWYIPTPIASYLTTQDWRAIILGVGLFVVAFIIYFPFFKAYDIQEKKKELALAEE
ncbi:PTS transporter subunit EIIC [Paenibacillus sp. S25]|uniref:PTS sugar transporter subunit IIC n=1 Tax=Paenibacillus sp. S25 TaxID=2823905 RepID=UPI001C6492B4|nr:PTS transporter subunit EIIC [Paenibacillus sp. S25]QYK62198.1 Lichenan permease IIC component [Paenibacillus sp. S25]